MEQAMILSKASKVIQSVSPFSSQDPGLYRVQSSKSWVQQPQWFIYLTIPKSAQQEWSCSLYGPEVEWRAD